ncbi:hypothetical protein Avbf_18896 [Armadillidium vulgare]|nr:hypothetical protein Avbf_18896 [Armadillidium vulgare]
MKNLIQAIFLLTIISFSVCGQIDYEYPDVPYCKDIDILYSCEYSGFWFCTGCHIPCSYDDYEDYNVNEDYEYYYPYYRGCENCCLNNFGHLVAYIK